MRVGALPTQALEAIAQGVATFLIREALFLNFLKWSGERGDGAFWMGRNMPKSIWLRNLAKAATTSGRPTKKPMRAPVTLNDLESEKNSTPTSSAPGCARNVPPRGPSKTMSE